ncbi:DNA-binding transcriptional regulator YbjK [Mycobacterium sp. OAS707]|uniref:TetR/AcrR family transcriptional regulator n=1 Tax=Mycobacterium sp. OAS707 TaxID=2663822 RepID=UPI00178A536D|nr:TetR family transcriptional regulator [Mycobacterium sp. OAS707]MBE1547022.1 DNA-binding transcriptional regulator YbjK [Mycobacterium sp. OAS707]
MTAPPRRRPRDPVGRRQLIVEAATRVIAEAGLAGLTHRRVAEVAGVPVGSTTYYFRDLDELREAALADAARGSIEGLDEWAEQLRATADLPGTLARLTADYLTDHDRYRACNELYTAASHRPELRPHARLWLDGLIAILEPKTGHNAAQAAAIFIDGALLHALITGEPLSTDVLTDALGRLLAS